MPSAVNSFTLLPPPHDVKRICLRIRFKAFGNLARQSHLQSSLHCMHDGPDQLYSVFNVCCIEWKSEPNQFT